MQIQANISLKQPGRPQPLPDYILDQLKYLHPKYRKNLSFFGGHPVSITKQSTNQIFNELSQKQDGTLQSPYLVCQKTDGVRYILLICHVRQDDLTQQQSNTKNNKFPPLRCYLISREGQQKLVSYRANINIGQGWIKRQQSNFKHIIQILDGELIMDEKGNHLECKYLIFDILIHLSQNITQLSLYHRLRLINKFIQCNNFLLENVPKQQQKLKIPIEIKDFFRLNCEKYNTIKFLLYKYIKCLPHQNDGLIFNHQNKPYQFGLNQGYIKWKPAHLNTLDFMLVPNTNVSDRFENRVLDLYLAARDKQIQGNYVRSFYAFTVVSQQQFQRIHQLKLTNKDKIFEMGQDQDQQQNPGNKSHFAGAVIAQCKFQQTKTQERAIFKQLFDIKKDPSQIYQDIMLPHDEQQTLARITSLQKMIYDRCWKIYKVRQDKGLPNNLNVAQKIQQSIKDNILQEQLMKKADELTQKCRKRF